MGSVCCLLAVGHSPSAHHPNNPYKLRVVSPQDRYSHERFVQAPVLLPIVAGIQGSQQIVAIEVYDHGGVGCAQTSVVIGDLPYD